jgi:hypothetical protein
VRIRASNLPGARSDCVDEFLARAMPLCPNGKKQA